MIRVLSMLMLFFVLVGVVGAQEGTCDLSEDSLYHLIGRNDRIEDLEEMMDAITDGGDIDAKMITDLFY